MVMGWKKDNVYSGYGNLLYTEREYRYNKKALCERLSHTYYI